MWVRQVELQQWQPVDHLGVDHLDRELGPARHMAGRHVLLLQGLLAACEDVLQVLQARGLQWGQQVANLKKGQNRDRA